MKKIPEFQIYFPDKWPKGRYPDREYFYNVLNTTHHNYCQRLIAHANEQRFAASGQKAETNEIRISEEWWQKLNAMPFVSRKFACIVNLFIEHKGRTLNLLKASSKPVPEKAQRRKYDIFGMPDTLVLPKSDHEMLNEQFRDVTMELKRGRRGNSKEKNTGR